MSDYEVMKDQAEQIATLQKQVEERDKRICALNVLFFLIQTPEPLDKVSEASVVKSPGDSGSENRGSVIRKTVRRFAARDHPVGLWRGWG